MVDDPQPERATPGLDGAADDGAPAGPVTAAADAVEVAVPDGPLGARVAAIPGLDLAERPDAFAELDAAIVAELRAIEDL